MSMAPANGETSSWARQIKDRIKRRYSRLAGEDLFPTGGAARVLAAGYPADWIAGVPASLLAGYAGCGNPLAGLNLANIAVAVDLGCGAGLDSFLLAQRLPDSAAVISIDFTEEILRRANRDWPKPYMIRPVTGDLEDIPLANDCADLVIANAAFNLTLDKARAFSEAARILKPGGKLAVRDLIKDREIPREVMEDPLSDATSLGGVVSEAEMREAIAVAGLTDFEFSDPQPFSYVTSIHLTAQKPD